MRRKPIYVCRLSVTNTPYLGIDLTDEGKKTNAVGIAEARYGYRPKNTAASYYWEFESPRHGVIAAQAWSEMVRQWEAKQRSIDEMRKEFGWDSVECASAEFDCALYEWFYDDEDLDSVLGGEERTGENSKILSDVKDPDTYNFAQHFDPGVYDWCGDSEIRARAAETSGVYHVELDWANPGCQYSKEPYGPKK